MPRKVSIRTKLSFIVTVAILPTVGFTLFSAWSLQVREAESRMTAHANLCETFVAEQNTIIRNAEEMLQVVSLTDAVQTRDYDRLNAYLQLLVATHSEYVTILAVDERSMVVASGIGRTGYSLADRPYLQEAMKTGGFTIGGFIYSRSTGISSMTYTLPVYTAKGTMLYLVATWSLAHYQRVLSLDRLSEGTVLEIFDDTGGRLFSSNSRDNFLSGGSVDSALLEQAQTATTFQPVRLGVADAKVLVSSGTSNLFTNLIHVSLRTDWVAFSRKSWSPALAILAVLLMASAGSFAAALFLARRLFIDRLEKLTRNTHALADGDLSIRSQVNRAQDEITTLIVSFNNMASILEERDVKMHHVLEEKEGLLIELRKRISDNLQLLSSMVTLQIDHSVTEEERWSLTTVHARIMALALVYETLYRCSDLRQVHIQRYCTGLCDYLISSFADVGSGIEYIVTGSEFELSIERALPLALILNELVSNCIQHAFAGCHAGLVSIKLSGDPAQDAFVSLSVSDNGKGFDGKLETHGTLGFQLVEALAAQINAEIGIRSDETGSTVELIFPSAFVRMSGTELFR